MSDQNSVEQKRRVNFLMIFMGIVLILYVGNLFKIQIYQNSDFSLKAKIVAQQKTVIPAQRGEIFDTHFDTPLVQNIDSFAVSLVPAELNTQDMNVVFAKLAKLLKMEPEEISKKIPLRGMTSYVPIEIKSGVSYDIITYIAERQEEFAGITWSSKPIRNYILDATSLSHVVGYMGNITPEELQILYNEGYTQNDVIGKSGIEKQYDIELRGKDGALYNQVDVKGRKLNDETSVSIEEPIMGKNVVLTIDKKIQTLCEKALLNRVGSIVVLKPSTGEILAMVSYPWYDPNIFNREITSKESQEIFNNPDKPFLNRVIQAYYAPASTFKIMMAAAIIDENLFPLDKKIVCEGAIYYGDRRYRCWNQYPGHGPLNLQQGLANSCDVYFYTVGRDVIGPDRMISYAKDFGLGQNTAIDLPGEITGLVPTPAWKESTIHEKWLGGDTINMVIGQGFTVVTPLQLADMVAMVANSGTIYKPHLLKEIRDPISGALISKVQPEVLKKSQIKPESFKILQDDMRSVVTEGTARYWINTKVIKVAAKTGTAQIGELELGNWHFWLVSYGPYDAVDPKDQIVVVVQMESSNPWHAAWSPYATSIIYQGIFGNQDYDEAVRSLGLQYVMPATTDKENETKIQP